MAPNKYGQRFVAATKPVAPARPPHDWTKPIAHPKHPSPAPRAKRGARKRQPARGRKALHIRKPRTAYAFYVHCFFKEYRRKHPREKINLVKVSKKCAAKWHTLSKRSKKKFYDMAAMDKSRYMLRNAESHDSKINESNTKRHPNGNGKYEVSSDEEGGCNVREKPGEYPAGYQFGNQLKIQLCNSCQRELSEACSSPRTWSDPYQQMMTTSPRRSPRRIISPPKHPLNNPFPMACFRPPNIDLPSKNPSVASGRPSRMIELPERKRVVQRVLRRTPMRSNTKMLFSGRVPTPPLQCRDNRAPYGDEDDEYEDVDEDEEEVDSDIEEIRSRHRSPRGNATWPQTGCRLSAVSRGRPEPQYRIPAGGRHCGPYRMPPPVDHYKMMDMEDRDEEMEEEEDEEMVSDESEEDSPRTLLRLPLRQPDAARLSRRPAVFPGPQMVNGPRSAFRPGIRRARQQTRAPAVGRKRRWLDGGDQEPRTSSKRLRQNEPDYYT